MSNPFAKQLARGFKYAVFQYADSDSKYLLDIKTASCGTQQYFVFCNWWNKYGTKHEYYGEHGGFPITNCKTLKFYKRRPKFS